jgi:hypothetical protein
VFFESFRARWFQEKKGCNRKIRSLLIMNLNTVNPPIEPPGALYFNLLFWKKLFNKNAINSHFLFGPTHYVRPL